MSIIPKYIVDGPFYYAKQNGYLKVLTGHVWKMNGLERRATCLQSLLTLKKDTKTFNFESN